VSLRFHQVSFFFLLPFLWNVAQASEIKTLYLSDEPLLVMDKNGESIGVFADLFKLAAKELNRDIEIKRLPWKRAQITAETSSQVAIGPLTRTPKRESKFSWIAPLFQMRITYMSKSDSQSEIKSIENAQKLRIGIKRATASVYASKLHKIPAKNVQTTDSHEQLLQMLDIGRIDSWLVWDLIGYRAHKLFGENISISEGYSENLGDLYFAGSKDISKQEKALWHQAFEKVIKRGDMADILMNYTGYSTIGVGPILAHQ